MTAIIVDLALAGALVVVALILLTSLIHRTSVALNGAVDGLRTIEAIEGRLIRHSRMPDPAAQASIEADIRTLLDGARREALNRADTDVMSDAVERYFSTYHAATARGLTSEQATARASTELATAFSSARRWGDVQVARARDAQNRAASWNSLANWIGVVAAFFMAVLTGLGVVWIRDLTFARSISGAMQRFRRGDQHSRAPIEGPLEAREIAQGFNDMAEELSRKQNRELAFLSSIVHDFRNPLAALQLSTARLTSSRARPSDEEVTRIITVLQRQIDLLNRMTGDLLDSARITHGELELKKGDRDLRDLARDSVELFDSAAQAHRLTLDVSDTPIVAFCDGLRIEQVLNNLISNAIKYSPRGGTVAVRVALDGDDAVVSVNDEGVGILPGDLPHIFEPFRRTGASREAVAGVGLGLFVSKRIVEAHGGRIEVESSPGQGSTFRVYLPARQGRPEVRPEPRAPEPPAASP